MPVSPVVPRRGAYAIALFLSCAAALPGQTSAPAAAATSAGRELVLHKWSGALNVPDPVACAVDPQGRVYVAATTRRKVGDLDIREHPMWIPNDVALTSVADKRAFYHDVLAPGKMRAPRGGLQDHNGDGSIDWKDLMHHSERIYQLRDTDGDGTADKMTVFAEGFNTEVTGIAAGVMYHDGWVYATIAPDLWRFKDTDDDGVADIREVVVSGFGLHIAYAGHDMHGLTVGPDGRIYWSIGDKGVNVTWREGRQFYFPNEGCILRIEPDGSNFEVYARGVRNPQEPAFDDFGDLFAVDNDADMRGERERFVYLPEASDSGWRCNYQYMKEASPWMREGYWRPHFPGQPAYLLPPIESYSDGPAGFRHDPGTALGEAQRGMFLLNEFPSGKMRGFRAARDGASFKMLDARILNDGIMGIGMNWHPDGSLMMVDWIGGYPLDGLGALWRVDAPPATHHPQRGETQELLRSGFARREEPELVSLLAHADGRVRQGAQLELAKRGKAAELLAVAARSSGAELLARIHAIWGYGQLMRRSGAEASAILPLLGDADSEIRRQTAKVLGDAAGAAARGHGQALIPLLADESPRVRSIAAIAVSKFREPAAVDALFALAARDGSAPVLRHAAATGLADCATPAQLAARKTDPSVDVRRISVVALRRQRSPLAAEFLADSDPLVVQEAALAIHDETAIPEALPALAAHLETVPTHDAIARRAINANLRVGTREAAARLLAFSLNEAAPRTLREQALIALRVWKNPPPLDRVDGYARTFATASIEDVLQPKLEALLAISDPALQTIAVEIMIAHQLAARPEQVAAIVADAGAAAELRAQALRLMAGKDRSSPAAMRAIDAALASDSPAPLYRTALELLLPGGGERLAAEVPRVLRERTVSEQQHAIALLARAGHARADAVLAELADDLIAGRAAAELKLDAIEALQARREANPALAAKLEAYSTNLAPKQPHSELLAGGSVAAGREIVLNHLNANCLACHAVEPAGGSAVGPNLASIGRAQSREYLLRALIEPSADIAIGYGLVNVTLKDGTEITGTLASETPDVVTVRLFDGTMKRVPRAKIATQSPAISIMPPMIGILQPRELRDVVAYLASLDGQRRDRTANRRDDGE